MRTGLTQPSTLPGGPADKAGIVHETLWGVAGMVQVITGQADLIRVEEPRTEGAEFYLERGGTREYWQAKRQLLSQSTWSLQKLNSEGLLEFFWQQAEAGHICVFASITDAPELRGLAGNAARALDWEEFQASFLQAQDWKKHFADLTRHLGSREGQSVFEFLRRVRVEEAAEVTLESFLLQILRAWFNEPPLSVLDILSNLYVRGTHQRFAAADLLRHLRERKITSRALIGGNELENSVRRVTAAYLAGQHSRLIRRTSIPRESARDIVDRLAEGKGSLDILITAPAGGGKSAVLCQVVEGLVSRDIPVLAFRLDQVARGTSTKALGGNLDLPESPALVLSHVAANRPVVLVLDQVDCVSAASGRHQDFFEVVAALAEEVRGLRASRHVHLLMACRRFDFMNDNRIRRLLPPGEQPVEIGPLSEKEVADVITEAGGHPTRFSAKQLALLQLPQNLALFVEAGLVTATSPGFVTQKHLLDAYWDAKRRAVSERCPAEAEQWTRALEKLTDEMSEQQELSVPKEKLDEFPMRLLDAMASEGVLADDGKSYAFGHESLFDYCFARRVVARDQEFAAFLEEDDQELFRRGQLRQVLVYLRDGDEFPRYLRNVERVLASKKIRPHLKLLTLELMAAFADPREEEFQLFAPLLESELACRHAGTVNPDATSRLAYAAFFTSGPLFELAVSNGSVGRWLHDSREGVKDQMTFYLRWQERQHPERVTGLLRPFVGKGGQWRDRLRFIIQWASLTESRPFFDLFLVLLDNGTLDEARGPIAMNSTFWSMLHGLAEKRSAWCAEAAAHWLDRKVEIARSSIAAGNPSVPSLSDQFGTDNLLECARRAPEEYLAHVFPSILRAAETFVWEEENGFQRDHIWPYRPSGDHLGMAEAFTAGCEIAFDALGADTPEKLRPYIALLRQSRLVVAGRLLQCAYASAPATYADEALLLLTDEPARIDHDPGGGFSLVHNLIAKCSLHCSDDCFRRIEGVLLPYKTSYERSKEGFRYQGYAAYGLASALSQTKSSDLTKRRLQEWKRKFGVFRDESPRGQGGFLKSPISENSLARMKDEHWLRAVSKHSTDRGARNWDDFLRGGAYQLGAEMRKCTEREPVRFANLALRFPSGSNPTYLTNVLHGLKGAAAPSNLKIAVARLAFGSANSAWLMASLDLLSSIEDEMLPEDAVQFIREMAAEHPHPEASSDDQRENLLQHGINTVRGHGVTAISSLIHVQQSYCPLFQQTIARCVRDDSLAVRACVAIALSAAAAHDAEWALARFHELIADDDRLLTAQPVTDFMAMGLREHIAEFHCVIVRMLRSSIEGVRRVGGQLACLARLYHPSLNELAQEAVTGDSACRLGAAGVASRNLLYPQCRAWCETTLMRFFNDESDPVREKAAGFFWHLWKQPEAPLTDYDALIASFLCSRAFGEHPGYLLHALEDTNQRVPDAILDVCEAFVSKCAAKARDISTAISAYESTVGTLVFRAYVQLKGQPLRRRALDLIDAMCLEGLQSAGKQMAELER